MQDCDVLACDDLACDERLLANSNPPAPTSEQLPSLGPTKLLGTALQQNVECHWPSGDILLAVLTCIVSAVAMSADRPPRVSVLGDGLISRGAFPLAVKRGCRFHTHVTQRK